MKIIVGLGNPGREYANTKHNVGFMVIDRLAEKLSIDIRKIKFKGLYGEGFIGSQKVILLKPQTYMNLSGESIREIVDFYKIDVEDLLVIYDDLDIDMGALRIRGKGSAGTHNGMRSVIQHLGDDGFPRIRVGIGGERKGDLVNYVISGFSGDDKERIAEAVQKAADAAECLVAEGISEAMNKFNTKKKKKKKVKEEQEAAEAAQAQDEKKADGAGQAAAEGKDHGTEGRTGTEESGSVSE